MFRPRFALRAIFLLFFASIAVFPACAFAGAPQAPAANVAAHKDQTQPALLPEDFAGWQIEGTPRESADPQAADNSDAAVLREYGFSRYENASYSRNGESLQVRAIQFGDATGAFGAFTFYRRPNMQPEKIGQGAAFDGSRVLFWSGTVLVDAKLQHVTPMTASELRDLASQLPKPLGNQATLPTLPLYLPTPHLDPLTIRYAIGSESYARSGGVLPPALVDFGRSAEVVTAQYASLSGPGTLTIINYPTPEIARDRRRAIQDFFASHAAGKPASGGPAWTSALAESNPDALQCRRSGPLVAVTSGAFTAGVAGQLLQQVHYEVNLTMSNSKHIVSDTVKVAQIILSVAVLVGIFALIAVVAAASLGGGRVAWRRMRGKSGAPDAEGAEFIRLNLKE